MEVYVKTRSGRVTTADAGDLGGIEGLRSKFTAVGAPPASLEALMISASPFPISDVDPASTPTGNTPPVPQPPNADTMPPEVSPTIEVARSTLDDVLLQIGGSLWLSHSYIKAEPAMQLLPPLETAANLIYYRWWQNTASFRLTGPQTFSRSVTTKEGSSATASWKLSFSLGVEQKALSAKLTSEFSMSFTVTSERSVTEQYSIEVPDGKICIYTIWQMMNQAVIVDDDNRDLEYEGTVFAPGHPLFWMKPSRSAELDRPQLVEATQQYALDVVCFDA